MGTIITSIILLIIVVWAVFSVIKNRKKGGSSCGGDCSSCLNRCNDETGELNDE